jgi:hypothetical protein
MEGADEGPPADLPRDAMGSSAPRGWSLPLVLAVALAAASWALVSSRMKRETPPEGPHGSSAGATAGGSWTPSPPPDPAAKSVTLTIDFGNGATRSIAALPWRDGMTVGDVMRAARQFSPGVDYEVRGTGAGGRCWLYKVDDRPGEVSFEVQPVAAGERVLWEFSRGE